MGRGAAGIARSLPHLARPGRAVRRGRVRLLLAQACDALSDTDGAARALDAAAEVFDRLGAKLDTRKLADAPARAATARWVDRA